VLHRKVRVIFRFLFVGKEGFDVGPLDSLDCLYFGSGGCWVVPGVANVQRLAHRVGVDRLNLSHLARCQADCISKRIQLALLLIRRNEAATALRQHWHRS